MTMTSRGIERVTSGETGWSNYRNHDGVGVLGVYRWLPDLQIGLVAERAITQAFAPVLFTATGTVLVALMAVLITVLLANRITRGITKPIGEMTLAAQAMMSGDLNQVIHVERDDEIGTLGQAFNHMAEQLRNIISGLELTVAERTRQLQQATNRYRKRAARLEASAEISRAAASILEPQALMQTTVDLIASRFEFYHVSLFLLDDEGEWAVVRASTGQVGRELVAQAHRLRVGGRSMVGWTCAQRQPRIALDVGGDAVHFDNPLLPDTRSELALPLVVGDKLLGALNVQSTQAAAFDDEDVRTLQGMADLIAIALENARLFAETQKSADHQRMMATFGARLQRARNTTDVVKATLQEVAAFFDLEQATFVLGGEYARLADDNGRDFQRHYESRHTDMEMG
jgi:nitrate/nitrite-specific signal transduction histidine kinase